MACPDCMSGKIILLDRVQNTPPANPTDLIMCELGGTNVKTWQIQITTQSESQESEAETHEENLNFNLNIWERIVIMVHVLWQTICKSCSWQMWFRLKKCHKCGSHEVEHSQVELRK